MKKENDSDSPVLSILIGSITERHISYTKLMNELYTQREELWLNKSQIEIISLVDNKEISIGKKRQLLLEKAKGEFICFIDDDDFVYPNYTKLIYETILNNPDIDSIGMRGTMTTNGSKDCTWKVSNVYDGWYDDCDGFKYVRCTHHWCPVRREHALAVGFPDERFGEDYPYSLGLREYCKKEVFIDENIYHYNYNQPRTQAESKKKYGIK